MKNILIVLLIIYSGVVYGQYGFRSAAGNSGVVVGTNNASMFTGINYDLSSSKLGLSFRQTTQEKDRVDKQDKENNPKYPNFFGHNAYLGIGIKDSKSTLSKNSIWQGNIEAAYDFSFTWDNTPIDTTIKPTGIANTQQFFSPNDPARTPFKSKSECESKFGPGCNAIQTNVSFYELDDYENRTTLLNQSTLFFRISNSVGRQNIGTLKTVTIDTSISLSDEFSIVPRLAVGFNQKIKFSKMKNTIFTFAASGSSYYIPKSTGLLKEYLFMEIGHNYNSKTISQMTSKSNKNYFLGETKEEWVFNPRFDLVMSIRLGDKKPYLNIIGAISPTFSSFTDIKWKYNHAIGLGLSLPLLPDQMVFAILYEGLALNKEIEKANVITCYASVPFSFK